MEKREKLYRPNLKSKPLMQSQIENAMKVTRSNRAAAEYLRVNYLTYKKYAKTYVNKEGVTLYDAHKNQSGIGISKRQVSKRRYLIDDILLGKYDTYPRYKILRRLFVSGYLQEKCTHCGFCQKRPTDLRTPLVVNHFNGNIRDFKLDNLEVLCYNCYFILVGDLRKVLFKPQDHYERPEETIPELGVLNNPDNLEALKAMDLLSEDEKLELLKELQNL